MVRTSEHRMDSVVRHIRTAAALARYHSHTWHHTSKLLSGACSVFSVSSHLSLRNREGVSVGRLPIVGLYEHARGAHVLEVDDVCRPIPELSTDGVKRGRLFTPPGHGHSHFNLVLRRLNPGRCPNAVWKLEGRVYGGAWCVRMLFRL